MYLTQITVDTITASKQPRIDGYGFDGYGWHQRLFHASPHPRFRVYEKEGCLQTLLLSEKAPTIQPWGTWTVQKIPDDFYDHNRYVFSLLANPTMKKVIRNPDGTRAKQGVRIPRTDVGVWFGEKAEKNGFKVLEASIIPRGIQMSHKGGKSLQHTAVEIQGILQVTDREAFKKAAIEGIGSSKGFGFGLLLLKKSF